MKHELLTIENGMVAGPKNLIFKKLYLQIFERDIISIIFDSVAEKKCLINLFEGATTLLSGEIYSSTKSIPLEQSARFMKNNITVIGQNNNLIPSLKIEENIFLFSQKNYIVLKRKFTKRYAKLLEQFHLSSDLDNTIKPLGYKNRIIIEMLKAYVEHKKLIVLTDLSGLIHRDLDELYHLILQMKAYGISFIIIEPVANFVSGWLNQTYIIQHGQTVRMLDASSTDRHKIHSVLLQSDSPPTIEFPQNTEFQYPDREVLQIAHVYTDALEDLTLTLKAGDLIKMLYLDEHSCNGLIGLLNGTDPVRSGRIILNGHPLCIKNIYHAVKKGLCFVNESPYSNMLFYNLSIRDNIALSLARKKRGLWLNKGCLRSINNNALDFLQKNIMQKKLHTLDPAVLQQIAYLKWILYAAKVVVCIRPFNEIDVHITEMTLKMIRELQNNGTAVLVLSPELSALKKIRGTEIYFRSGRVISKDEFNHFFCF